jgi:hypothetical protein
MGFFRKIGNALARFMYGRNGVDQLSLAMIWISLILDVAAMLAGRASALAGSLLYWIALAMWVWVIFRIFSKNLYRRRNENSKFLTFVWSIRNQGSGARARRADKEHRYYTCKNCKTVCRVPKGKGKIVITCPKCGAQIHTKT